MPKKRRGRAKEQKADVGTAGEIAQEPERLPDNRPQTRAWVKQQESRKSGAALLAYDTAPETTGIVTRSKAKTAHTKDSTAGLRQLEQPRQFLQAITARQKIQSRNSSQAAEHSTQAVTVPNKGTQPTRQPHSSKQSNPVTSKELARKDDTNKSKHSTLTAWLSEVESPLRGSRTGRLPSTIHESEDTMDSSSASRESTRELTRESGQNESTARAIGSKSVKVSDNKLRLRRVNREPTPDERLCHFKSILKTELAKKPLKDLKDMRSILEHFLEQMDEKPNDNCYSYIDEFSYSFDEGKSKINYPIINRRYFEADLKRCLARNEAVLQRTIMISIVNQYWLGKIFDWNSEGQWSQPKDTRLPSREDDDISLPKPDLAISFTLKSFTGDLDDSDPIPADLEKCLSPDGGGRCFPFLFMEVKKAGADLQDAYIANLHSASQALFNMYSWMTQAGKEQEFFDTIRVFSLVFNAQDLSVRIHRAERLPTANGALKFQFDEFSPLDRYTKDQACLLIKTILNNYAAPDLHPTLKAAFVEVVNQEDERVTFKRKGGPKRSSSTKRARREQNTGQSFNMANLST